MRRESVRVGEPCRNAEGGRALFMLRECTHLICLYTKMTVIKEEPMDLLVRTHQWLVMHSLSKVSSGAVCLFATRGRTSAQSLL